MIKIITGDNMKEFLKHHEFYDYVKERLSNTDLRCDECDFRQWENCLMFNANIEKTEPGNLCQEWFYHE